MIFDVWKRTRILLKTSNILMYNIKKSNKTMLWK